MWTKNKENPTRILVQVLTPSTGVLFDTSFHNSGVKWGGHIRQMVEQSTPGYHLQKLKKAALCGKSVRGQESRGTHPEHI